MHSFLTILNEWYSNDAIQTHELEFFQQENATASWGALSGASQVKPGGSIETKLFWKYPILKMTFPPTILAGKYALLSCESCQTCDTGMKYYNKLKRSAMKGKSYVVRYVVSYSNLCNKTS
jgi:hypothetical protein